ncbi:hypothetical protein GCM10007159_41370 [Modicisalibacter luteus]|nr:hypothetical protein GCM10007159_41370 [Halomonas lutea]
MAGYRLRLTGYALALPSWGWMPPIAVTISIRLAYLIGDGSSRGRLNLTAGDRECSNCFNPALCLRSHLAYNLVCRYIFTGVCHDHGRSP